MSERAKTGEDRWLTWSVAALTMAGIVIIYDASFPKTGVWHLVKQSVWAAVGLLAYKLGKQSDLRVFHRLTFWLAAIAIVMMLAVRLPGIGEERGGAFRWIRLGQIGPVEITLQPAEFGKLALIFLLARLLSSSSLIGACSAVRERRWPVFVILAICTFTGIVVVVQEDLGSALIFLSIGIGMLFVGGMPMRRLLVLLALIGVAGCFFILQKEYRKQRIVSLTDPFAYMNTTGYQLAHSLMGIGTGGVWGAGFGLGRAKEFLPAADTDFVFTTIAEETGIWGSTIVVSLLAVVAWRILRIAQRTQAMYPMLLAGGVGIMVALQSLLNLYVATGAAPTTGVPLPFISYGGSSLVSVLFGIGLTQKIACSSMSERVTGESHARTSGGRRNWGASVSRREYRRGVA